MLLTDFVQVFDDALPSRFCTELIRRFDASPNVIEGKVGIETGPHLPDVRSCLELNIYKDDAFKDLLPHFEFSFKSVVMRYKSSIKGVMFPEQSRIEQFRMKRYRAHGPHPDYFREHVDVNSAETARRFLVCFFYLNTVQEGGETTFPSLNLSVQPKQGRVLCFPPMWMFPHAGESPISADKYICGSYLHYV